MLNRITVMGRLTRDPDLRHTQTDIPVVRFSVACDRDFKEKNSDKKATDFIDCVAWRSTAEFVDKFFTKGRMAVVDGRLQIRDWTDKEGNKRRSAEIVADNVYFGDSKPQGDGKSKDDGKSGDDGEPPAYKGGFDAPDGFQPDFDDEDDGELPF